MELLVCLKEACFCTAFCCICCATVLYTVFTGAYVFTVKMSAVVVIGVLEVACSNAV